MTVSSTNDTTLPALDAGQVTGAPGETVTVTLTLTNASGYLVSAVSTDISYDTGYLENPSVSIGATADAAGKDVSFREMSSGKMRLGIFSAANNTVIGDGIVAYVSFKIKSTASKGQTTLGNTPSGSDPSGNDVIMTGSAGTVTVSFSSFLYVSGNGNCGDKTPCHQTIQEAVDAAGNGSAIRIAGGTYAENITLNEAKALTLEGGWNSIFSAQTENSILKSAPKAVKGSLTMQMLRIKP